MAGFISKVKQDFIDVDYFHKLSYEELEFLEAFLAEEVNGDTNHNFKKLNKMTKSRKRQLWGANNSKNRDAFAQAKARGMLDFSEGGAGDAIDGSIYKGKNTVEDAMIEYLHHKRRLERRKKLLKDGK